MPIPRTLPDPKALARTLHQLGVQDLGDRKSVERSLAALPSTADTMKALEQLSTFDSDKRWSSLAHAFSSTGAHAAATKTAPAKSGVGGAGKMRFDVERLLPTKLYADGKVGRPLERVLVHIGRLHEGLAGAKNVDALIDRMVQQDTRKHLFMLEGLLRTYADRCDDADKPNKVERRLDKSLARAKELEDALGAYGYAVDMLKGVEGKSVAPAALGVLKEAVTTSKSALADVLTERGWIPEDGKSARLQKLADAFADVPFGSVREDTAYLKGALADLVHDIANKPLDMSDLEGGLHELRRQLRWLPIIFIALDGQVRLDEHAPSKFDALKKDPIAQSPFAKLPTSTSERTGIDVPQGMFLALSKAIGDLGKIKDRGQLIEGLAHALDEGDVVKKKKSEAEAEQILGTSMKDVFADATALQKALESSGLLRDLERALRA